MDQTFQFLSHRDMINAGTDIFLASKLNLLSYKGVGKKNSLFKITIELRLSFKNVLIFFVIRHGRQQNKVQERARFFNRRTCVPQLILLIFNLFIYLF